MVDLVAASNLTNARIDIPIIIGTIKAAYIQSERSFEMNITIPANTTAQIHLPIKGKKHQVWEGDKKVKFHIVGQWVLLDNVGSGEHHFRTEYL
jgi:alpha-L-rhamnosidase